MEGQGQVTMRDLVKNCLRMRPERIIVGEVRGPEAFDLLQAMNTGHDGSMGTLHANSPRECLSRIESMISMGGATLPSKTLREMICGSIDVVIQAMRLRDGSRRITHITEVIGMEGEVITTQDIFLYDILGEDAQGKLIGRHRSTGVGRPKFWERARYYGLERRLGEALDAAEVVRAGAERRCRISPSPPSPNASAGGRASRGSRSRRWPTRWCCRCSPASAARAQRLKAIGVSASAAAVRGRHGQPARAGRQDAGGDRRQGQGRGQGHAGAQARPRRPEIGRSGPTGSVSGMLRGGASGVLLS